jgi:cytochrome c oxidase subunit 1
MIGVLYFFLAVMCGFVGYLYSCFLRYELHCIGSGFLFGDYHLYNLLITAHGLLMIFAFVMPVILGGYANFYAPLMCGFPDMLFPRMNNLSFWLFVLGCCIFVTGFACEEGVGVGWTLYPTLICIDFHFSIGVDFVLFAVHILGISSVLNSLNIVGTFFVVRRKF